MCSQHPPRRVSMSYTKPLLVGPQRAFPAPPAYPSRQVSALLLCLSQLCLALGNRRRSCRLLCLQCRLQAGNLQSSKYVAGASTTNASGSYRIYNNLSNHDQWQLRQKQTQS